MTCFLRTRGPTFGMPLFVEFSSTQVVRKKPMGFVYGL